jgi:hypothetical protein
MKTHALTTIAAAAILAGFRFPVAFDNKAGWKLDKDGKIEMKDGNPVYLDSAGNEMTVAGDTISRLNGEAKTHREAKEAAETALAKFKGADGKLIDPAIAIKAIETVGKIDAKKLIDAGEVDKVRDAVKAEFTAQLAEKDAKIGELGGTVKTMTVDKVFDSSQFVRNRVAVPVDMFRDSFGKNVKVGDDGKLEFYGRDGNKLMSKKNVGEYATGDEAFELMIEQHPQKDTIMKAADASGSGNNGGGGARGGGRFMSRAEFEKLEPGKAKEAAEAMGKGELTVN